MCFQTMQYRVVLTTHSGDCQRMVAGVAVYKQNNGPFSLQEREENVLKETQEHFFRDPSIRCFLKKCLFKALHGIESRISAGEEDQERWKELTDGRCACQDSYLLT